MFAHPACLESGRARARAGTRGTTVRDAGGNTIRIDGSLLCTRCRFVYLTTRSPVAGAHYAALSALLLVVLGAAVALLADGLWPSARLSSFTMSILAAYYVARASGIAEDRVLSLV